MAICRACSCEITGPDRYCRNCGALVVTSVTELDDTHRFRPSAPLPPPVTVPDATNPLYYSSPAAPQSSAPLYQTASFARKLLKGKFVWMLIALIFATFVGVGIGIGSQVARRRSDWVQERNRFRAQEDVESIQRAYDEAVQNALGFMQGEYSAEEFPDQQGIFVNNLMSDDSPAALAKIQAGDLLTELNNKQVRNNSELNEVINSLKTGDVVPLTVYRDGAMINLNIKLGDRHFPPLQVRTDPTEQGFLGILDSSRRCCIPGTKKWGVEVSELHVNGPAELFGLRVGDVIVEFNGHPVKTPFEFNRHIRAVAPRTKVPLTIYRGSTQQKVEVIIGHRWE